MVRRDLTSLPDSAFLTVSHYSVVNNKNDLEGYMLSIHRVAEMADIEPGSLGAASFWVGLRQEIYVAVIKKEMVRMPLVPSLVRSLTDGDDFTWANRAVVLCAEVLNYCYDRTKKKDQSRWEELCAQSRHWAQYRPASFTEIYQQDADEHAFPEIWYGRGCHGRLGYPQSSGETVDDIQRLVCNIIS
jgi:hypothetical protein